MFVNQTHQPQLLRFDQYSSQEQYDREVQNLFRDAWHFVGLKSEFQEGQFRTLALLSYPLIIWQKDGELHTFLNVCSHRSSMLSDKLCGQAEHLKCQYHGWEYSSSGETRKIPDSTSFRPLSRDMASLKKYRTGTVGDLVFVNLADESCSLAEYLGPGYAMCQEWFSPAWGLTLATEQDVPGNWKLLIENVLENYHLTEVHGQTFKSLPPEEACQHELAEKWTLYTEHGMGEHSHLRRMADVLYRILKIDPPPGIEVFHCFPHQVFVRMGLHTWVQAAIPEGPKRARNVWRFFHYRGTKPSPSGRIVAQILKIWGKRFFTRVLGEDAAILPAVQKGLDAPEAPVGGLISTREERIFQFQKFVLERTRGPGCAHSSPSEAEICEQCN